MNNDNINNTVSFINNTYDNLSYFDLYGNSVIIFIFITLLVFIVFSYCKIVQTKQSIADDWVNQRCKPQNMLFAGLISKPDGTTAFQYTKDNFQYCVQNILTNIAGYALEPFQYMVKSITQMFVSMAGTIQQTRIISANLRTNISTFGEDVFNRILNVIIPFQKIFISLKDTFQKIQGSMTSTLYTVLGTYYTLQALMSAILELIIKLLVALVVIIVGLWVVPFTWPAAASMSAVFLGISVPLAIVVYFMSEVLHIKSSSIPKLRCFDKDTNIKMKNGDFKKIKDIEVNDLLYNGSYVTSKIKVTSEGLDMYNLNGIIVSESHTMYDTDVNKWLHVSECKRAKLISKYSEKYLYCLNTSNKKIEINDILFTDWDTVFESDLDMLVKKFGSAENIHKHVDFGFNEFTKIKLEKETKNICDVQIGDILLTRGYVYGIVELKNDLGVKLYNLLVSGFEKDIYQDFNYNIDKILMEEKEKK